MLIVAKQMIAGRFQVEAGFDESLSNTSIQQGPQRVNIFSE